MSSASLWPGLGRGAGQRGDLLGARSSAGCDDARMRSIAKTRSRPSAWCWMAQAVEATSDLEGRCDAILVVAPAQAEPRDHAAAREGPGRRAPLVTCAKAETRAFMTEVLGRGRARATRGHSRTLLRRRRCGWLADGGDVACADEVGACAMPRAAGSDLATY